jgi:hypothetical protein
MNVVFYCLKVITVLPYYPETIEDYVHVLCSVLPYYLETIEDYVEMNVVFYANGISCR